MPNAPTDDQVRIHAGRARAKAFGCKPEQLKLAEESACCARAAFVHCGCTCLAVMNCPDHGYRHTYPFSAQGAPHP